MYRAKSLVVAVLCTILLTACASNKDWQHINLSPPAPIEGNSGKFYSPYTSDDVLAPWVDKAVKVKLGAAVGSTVGQVAGIAASAAVPGLGPLLEMGVKSIGRKIALTAVGGWAYVKETSDLSFNKLEDLSIFVYAKYGEHEHYNAAVGTMSAIYPALQGGYMQFVNQAKQKTYRAMTPEQKKELRAIAVAAEKQAREAAQQAKQKKSSKAS